MPNGWECTRCGASNAPFLFQCPCSVKGNVSNSANVSVDSTSKTDRSLVRPIMVRLSRREIGDTHEWLWHKGGVDSLAGDERVVMTECFPIGQPNVCIPPVEIESKVQGMSADTIREIRNRIMKRVGLLRSRSR